MTADAAGTASVLRFPTVGRPRVVPVPLGWVAPVVPVTETYSGREVARLLSVPASTVYRLLAAGTIPAVRSGGRWFVTRPVLAWWLDSVRVVPPAPGPATA